MSFIKKIGNHKPISRRLLAILLSAALAMQGELSYLSNSASAVTEPPVPADSDIRLMAAVYGPPPAKTTTEAEITEAPVTTAAITDIPIITDDPFIFIEPVSAMYGPVMAIEDPNPYRKMTHLLTAVIFAFSFNMYTVQITYSLFFYIIAPAMIIEWMSRERSADVKQKTGF